MAVISFAGHTPLIAPDAYIAPSADLIGDVSIASGACVLFNAVVRGDIETISLGEGSNLQDGVVVHADPGFPTTIGAGVSVGHNATVHGCTIGNYSLIGMNATVLNGAVVGEGSLVAAGSVVLEGQIIPPRSLVAGIPAKVKRELTDEEYQAVVDNGVHYQALSAQYLAN
jgi:carbonic anhydrase/acetyltransferase-like protein (isoleucine patch superfamily)